MEPVGAMDAIECESAACCEVACNLEVIEGVVVKAGEKGRFILKQEGSCQRDHDREEYERADDSVRHRPFQGGKETVEPSPDSDRPSPIRSQARRTLVACAERS